MIKKLAGTFLFRIIALVVVKDLVESVADVFFKSGTLSTGISNVVLSNAAEFALRLSSNPIFWAGIALYLVNFFLWITLLSKVDLSIAFPMSSLTYIIVPILAIIFLGEHVAPVRWAGIFFIIAGVSLAGRGVNDNGKNRAIK